MIKAKRHLQCRFLYFGNLQLLLFSKTKEIVKRSRITYSKTAVLNPIGNMPGWLYTFVYYDDKGRVIQTVGGNQINTFDRISYKYDFTGNVLATIHLLYLSTNIVIGERYTYDHRGRVTRHYYQIAYEPEVLMAHYTYNELEQLTEKRL